MPTQWRRRRERATSPIEAPEAGPIGFTKAPRLPAREPARAAQARARDEPDRGSGGGPDWLHQAPQVASLGAGAGVAGALRLAPGALRHGAVEDAEGGSQRPLRHDREDVRLLPDRVDVGPVV